MPDALLHRIARFVERVSLAQRYAGAVCHDRGDAGGMALVMPVVVYPPDEDGGRRVRVDGEIPGSGVLAAGHHRILRRAGIADVDEACIAASGLIAWRGGRPDAWTH